VGICARVCFLHVSSPRAPSCVSSSQARPSRNTRVFYAYFTFCRLFPLSLFLSLTKREGRWDLMEVIISESPALSSIRPPTHHPHHSLHPHPSPPPTTPPPTPQHALKREGEDPLCLSPSFKQKTSSDLERPTTLLS